MSDPNRAAGPVGAVDGLRVVVVTNLYPSQRRPGWGTFVATRVAQLRAAAVEVELIQITDVPSATGRYGSLVTQTVGGVLGGLRARLPKRSAWVESRRVPAGLAGLSLPGGLAGLSLPTLRVPAAYPGRTVVEAHIAYPTGLFAWPLARSLGAPLVLFAHGSDVLQAPHRSRADALVAPRLFGAADLVIANSDYLADAVERLGVLAQRVEVISPGIDYRAFSRARDRAGADGVLRHGVLYVGHLIQRKAPDLVLAAVARLPAATRPTVRFIGVGPLAESLRVQAIRTGVSATFAGALPPAQVADAMARSAVVAVPSRQEALGLAALESMAAGAVTVVTRVGGLGGLIEDGRTGFVAAEPEPDALAMALTSALAAADDPQRAGPLRMTADAVAALHAAPRVARRSIDRYEALLAARAGRRELTARRMRRW